MRNKHAQYGRIGLWWYTDSRQVWARTWNTYDGQVLAVYYSCPDSHSHQLDWKRVVQLNTSNSEEVSRIVDLGYKHYERGRITYNFVTQRFSLTCSEELAKDESAIKQICEFFDIKYTETDVVCMPRYRRYIKTGDPSLDDKEYGFLP